MSQEEFFDFSNYVTYVRVILVFIVVFFLLFGNAYLYLFATVLIIIALFMDYVDGIVARKFNSVTDFGSVIDIVGDRIVENVLWIVFAYMGLIPLWVPLVIISRSFITDGFRSYALSKGRTAFGKKTMMKSNIGVFLVSSRASRAFYGIAKAVAFSMLSLQLFFTSMSYSNIETFISVVYAFVLFTVIFCVVRGIFVVYEGVKLFKQ